VIIVDTNVVSAAMNAHEPGVADWLDTRPASSLYFTSIGVGELLLGARLLPVGRRQNDLLDAIELTLSRYFGERILPYDILAATHYALIISNARAAGRTVLMADAQIAAIAVSNGFKVATRDKAPFVDAGLQVIDPWTMQPH
jgi:predicted nucleic acid-binding protein